MSTQSGKGTKMQQISIKNGHGAQAQVGTGNSIRNTMNLHITFKGRDSSLFKMQVSPETTVETLKTMLLKEKLENPTEERIAHFLSHFVICDHQGTKLFSPEKLGAYSTKLGPSSFQLEPISLPRGITSSLLGADGRPARKVFLDANVIIRRHHLPIRTILVSKVFKKVLISDVTAAECPDAAGLKLPLTPERNTILTRRIYADVILAIDQMRERNDPLYSSARDEFILKSRTTIMDLSLLVQAAEMNCDIWTDNIAFLKSLSPVIHKIFEQHHLKMPTLWTTDLLLTSDVLSFMDSYQDTRVPPTKRCTKCKGFGHDAKVCNISDASNKRCWKCGGCGHHQDSCPTSTIAFLSETRCLGCFGEASDSPCWFCQSIKTQIPKSSHGAFMNKNCLVKRRLIFDSIQNPPTASIASPIAQDGTPSGALDASQTFHGREQQLGTFGSVAPIQMPNRVESSSRSPTPLTSYATPAYDAIGPPSNEGRSSFIPLVNMEQDWFSPYPHHMPYGSGMPPFQHGMPPFQPGMPPFQPGMPPFQPGMPPFQPGMPHFFNMPPPSSSPLPRDTNPSPHGVPNIPVSRNSRSS
eukprot:TRINITY_DN1314_c0_g1_i12.p1 TRINITY_DN1314_c0_g1~~TRINITY_DN1314_c0_g1_i12.p1  ORF type:complete len:582 (+),score=86.03 TRINITY_DN1314_c0_g1_i12:662-2407(+)